MIKQHHIKREKERDCEVLTLAWNKASSSAFYFLFSLMVMSGCLEASTPLMMDEVEQPGRFDISIEVLDSSVVEDSDLSSDMSVEVDQNIKRQMGLKPYPIDEEFLKALETGLPESSGVAMGFDRLIMLLTGAEKIQDILWSPI